jgi:hypothetical protein
MAITGPADLLATWEAGLAEAPAGRARLLHRTARPDLDATTLPALPVGEREADLFALRRALFGERMQVRLECTACGEDMEFDLDAGELARSLERRDESVDGSWDSTAARDSMGGAWGSADGVPESSGFAARQDGGVPPSTGLDSRSADGVVDSSGLGLDSGSAGGASDASGFASRSFGGGSGSAGLVSRSAGGAGDATGFASWSADGVPESADVASRQADGVVESSGVARGSRAAGRASDADGTVSYSADRSSRTPGGSSRPAGARGGAVVRVRHDGWDVRFRLPGVADLTAAARAADPRAALLTRCLVSARRDGTAVPAADLPVPVQRRIAEAVEAADPGADVTLNIGCPECGEATRAELDIASYLWTELDAWARDVLLDVHLLATAYGWSEPEILALSPVRRRYYLELCADV